MASKISALIDHFQFDTVPIEGTLYKSTYVSKLKLENTPLSTAIIGMYSHEPKSISTFHRLTQDEMWHFYDGDPFVLHLLFPNGTYQKIVMGQAILAGQKVQFVVPANVWQAGELLPDSHYALYGCTLSPGFTGDCFEGGMAKSLIKSHPEQEKIIQKLSVEGHQTKMPDDFEQ
ncbi:MAG: cupin domain-containing protein [Bacteroidota bacterium]